MKTLGTVGLALSLVAIMGLSASAGAVAGGGLFVESAEGASSKLTISGELRSRLEVWQNFTDFSSSEADHINYVDSRVRLNLAFELTSGIEVVVAPQTRYIWGGWNGMNEPFGGDIDWEDRDSLDLYEAYVKMQFEVFGRQLEAKVGRQEIALGSEMLLGNDSKYAGLSWDAVRLDMQVLDQLKTTFAVIRVVENDVAIDELDLYAYPLGTPYNNDLNTFVLWNTYSLSEDAVIDAYLLYTNDKNEGSGTFEPWGFDAKIWTFGGRFAMNKLALFGQNFDASVEVAVQMGEVNITGEDLDIQDAFAFEAEVGWSPAMAWSPRLAIGMAWASGDDNGSDGNYNHFNSLAQDVQGRLGKADMFRLENIRCAYIDLTCKPMDIEKLSAGVSYLKFNAFEEDDAQGVGGGGIAGAPVSLFGGSNVNDTADEIDFYVGYKLNDNTDLKLCWSWIEPDDQIHDSGFGNSPAHRVHMTLVVDF